MVKEIQKVKIKLILNSGAFLLIINNSDFLLEYNHQLHINLLISLT